MKITNEEMNPLHGLSADDAIDLLVADHKRVAGLFAEFKRLVDEGKVREKSSVVQLICDELTVHAQLEEELFYPAVREATGEDDQVDEAVVEHAGAKALIAQLQAAMPEEALYDAKVTVLGEQIDHHVEEEEGSLFPKARHAGVDTGALGQQMLARKAALQGGGGTRVPPARQQGDPVAARGKVEKPAIKRPSPPKKKAALSKPGKAKPKAKRR